MMKILVYGAGNLGSLYAALLQESGQDVSLLARGKRLVDIRTLGIRLEAFRSGQQTTIHVKTVERLAPEDEYDLVLVILPKNYVAEVLPILAANRYTPSVMFFGNNAAGAGEMIEALGRDRVLLGFPGAAAGAHDGSIRYLILSAQEQPTTIGEPDGRRSERITAIADALRAAGFPVSICANMGAWLKTHAAEISPTANALYMTGGDIHRLARTRDAQLLMLRAIREGYRVLTALGIPITPSKHKIFQWLPEPLLLFLARGKIESDTTAIKIGHASVARNEMITIADEFGELIRQAGLATPSIDILRRHLNTETDSIPDGSARIRVSWRPVWIALGMFAIGAALVWQLLR